MISPKKLSRTVGVVVQVAFGVLVTLLFAPQVSVAASAAQGATLYKSKCVMCHGTGGSETHPLGTALKIVELRSSEVQKQSNPQLAAIVSHGKGKMPAFGNGLSKPRSRN